MASPSPARRRRAVPTRRIGYLFGLAFGAAAAAAFLPGAALLWKAIVLFTIALVLIDIASRPPAGAIEAERIVEPPWHVGRSVRMRLRLRNGTGARLEVRCRDVLPPAFEPPGAVRSFVLGAGEEEVVDRVVTCLERGEFRLDPAVLRVARPRGLLAYQEPAGETVPVKVLPGRPASETETLLARAHLLFDIGDRPVKVRGQDREFESLREFVTGDDIRFVDWKATARRRKPLVRQYQTERNAEVIFAIDCGRLMGSLVHGVRKLDLAMVPLLDLAAVALKRQDRVGLIAFDSKVRRYVPPRGGLFQLGRLMDSLAGLEAGFDQSSYSNALLHLEARHRKRSLVILLTDFTDEISAREMVSTLAALSRRHAVLFVMVSDPHLDEIFHRWPAHEREAYQQAVAGELITERRRVRTDAMRLGVFTVEADPRKLSAPMIARYAEIRSRVAI